MIDKSFKYQQIGKNTYEYYDPSDQLLYRAEPRLKNGYVGWHVFDTEGILAIEVTEPVGIFNTKEKCKATIADGTEFILTYSPSIFKIFVTGFKSTIKKGNEEFTIDFKWSYKPLYQNNKIIAKIGINGWFITSGSIEIYTSLPLVHLISIMLLST
ncbi:MAG: hypothetical protein JST49_08050, partial [Bacteroidetes bacterium]|nr:hypothetical protein [Bacteroidota bacterium]